jgi:anti-sigma regulatory factor (Ser/Thr protein kinase)
MQEHATPRAALRHDAFVHEGADDYVERSVRFLRDGLTLGEAAVVIATRDRLAALAQALGPDARRVALTDVGQLYTRPARTIAAYYATLLRHLRSAPSVRVLAEGQFGPTPVEWDEWMAYEAITNLAYAHLRAWIVCTYDATALPDAVVDIAWRTHAGILTEDWRPNHAFQDVAAVVRAHTPAPRSLEDLLRSLPAGSDPEALRERLAREMAGAGVGGPKAIDMLVAANEVALNAWQHGGGAEELRVGRAQGRFVCEISDRGRGFDDPLAGYLAPKPGERASGLWIARQLVWRLESFGSPGGHTVRLWL